MARNFDEEREQRLAERREQWAQEKRDRSFVLGGEIFEYAEFVPADVMDALIEASEGRSDAALRRMSMVIPRMIELGETEEEREATRLRFSQAKSRIDYDDIVNLCYWIAGEVGRRPTQAPSSSGERRETNGTGSMDTSSSPPVVSAVSES